MTIIHSRVKASMLPTRKQKTTSVELTEIEPSTTGNQEIGEKNEEKEEGPVYHKLEDTDEAESK